MEDLLKRATEVYGLAYFGLVLAVVVLEWVVPLRPATDTLRLRWLSNIGISILNTVLVRLLFPMVAVGWAALCQARGWGLFNQFAASAWITFPVTLVALDFVFYAQHRVLHLVPLLWRIHRTHHTDHEVDFSTGVRFHPLEVMIGTTVNFAAILVLGAPPLAVFAIQVLSLGVSFIDHANVQVPAAWDRVLRLVVVTPDMHRIHHSRNDREGQSNFSNLFSWWDRLFATYVDEPAAGSAGMTFGVTGFGDRKHLSVPWMLAQPFLKEDDVAGR